jgi:alkanesulfonate monooxygenase SsuD/methylene tetrahydromethanopterin reductase-like flavin-dependent oxidoreductase (luciferase family)
MRFGLYSELQRHPWQTYEQVYEETQEQIVNADRLGYECYSIIEHWFFDQFGISANPFAFFAMAAAKTRRIRFRTLLHILPYHNPAVLASQIAEMDLLTDGRYEFGVGRGHAWLPNKAGVPLDETRPRYEEAFDILIGLLENQDAFSYDGNFWKLDNARVVPRSRTQKFRIFTGGTSDRTYELAGEHGWGVVVPPLLPYEALHDQLEIYRESCAKHGNEPDIVFIHAVYMDQDEATVRREAEDWIHNFLVGNASPGPELPAAEELNAVGYQFYTSGALESLADMTWEQLTESDAVWAGTPEQVIEKIEAVQAKCEGLAEITITVNAGGVEHWKAIKTQELFAKHVMPHFRGAESREPAAAAAS